MARNGRARTATSKPLRDAHTRATPPKARADAHGPPQDAQLLTASQLLTADQLAERWQVPKTQVWRLAREGAVPVVRIGRYMRFRVDAIERWEDAQADA